MTYSVTISPRAARELRLLHGRLMTQVQAAIDGLASDPRPHRSIALKGKFAGDRRIRIGDYRIMYSVDDASHAVTVQRVTDRKEVYRDK